MDSACTAMTVPVIYSLSWTSDALWKTLLFAVQKRDELFSFSCSLSIIAEKWLVTYYG
jgi:hypothetical protein